MIPKNYAPTIVSDGLDGERSDFKIQANGKAFRVLVDKLYSNKIGAVVREIMSNGYDSHVAAGIPDAPISVTAPTSMDPTFRVRDYGVSMDHETVMHIYSTVFESTKEQTNDQVGMFGLGSKSPFAYTNTFSLTAILNGERRYYTAIIPDTGVPQIVLVGTEPCEDEPQGVEVAVPVEMGDVYKFQEEITHMIFASDVTPIVDGMGTNVPDVLLKGDGWRIVRDTHNVGRVAIRQGCVMYPVHTSHVRAVDYGYTVIVDVPIGSVDVTASRESVELTPETQSYIHDRVAETDQAIRAWAESIEFENRLDEYLRNNEFDFLTFGIGRKNIKFTPDMSATQEKLPGQVVDRMRSARKTDRVTMIGNVHQVRILVDRPGEHIVRKRMRMADYYKKMHRTNHTVLIVNDLKALARLVRIMGLNADQVVSVASLPDIVPPARAIGGSRTRSTAPKALPNGTLWVEKTGAKTTNFQFGRIWARHAEDFTGRLNSDLLKGLGVDAEKIVALTERQAKAMGATKARNLATVLTRRAEAYAEKTNLQDRLDTDATHIELTEYVSHQSIGAALAKAGVIPEQYNYSYGGHRPLIEAIQLEIGEPTEPDELSTLDYCVRDALELVGSQDLQTSDIDAKVNSMVEIFKPLSHTHGSLIDQLLTNYINNNQEDDSQ